jgi:hypothetical protein
MNHHDAGIDDTETRRRMSMHQYHESANITLGRNEHSSKELQKSACTLS